MKWLQKRRRPGFGLGGRVTLGGLNVRLGMCQFSIASIPKRVSGVGWETTLKRSGNSIILRITGDLTSRWLAVSGSYAARVGKTSGA